MAKPKGGLGKGLDALFVDNTATSAQDPSTLSILEIEPNPLQPRKFFHDEPLEELAESIRLHGVLQPLVVRPMLSGRYQIVAGERRWRASRMAGLSEVPVVVRELTEEQTVQWALVENLQRENLNPMEEAVGYAYLMEEFGFTQEEVAKSVGKSRPVVANALRLLRLPAEVQEAVRSGNLSAGHGRSLLALEDDQLIKAVAKEILEKGLSVRQIERMAKNRKQQQAKQGDLDGSLQQSSGLVSNTPTSSTDCLGTSVHEMATHPTMAEWAAPQIKLRDEHFWGNAMIEQVKASLEENLNRPVSIEGTLENGRLCITFYGERDLLDLFSVFNDG